MHKLARAEHLKLVSAVNERYPDIAEELSINFVWLLSSPETAIMQEAGMFLIARTASDDAVTERKIFSYPVDETIDDAEKSRQLIFELEKVAQHFGEQFKLDDACTCLYAANYIRRVMARVAV